MSTGRIFSQASSDTRKPHRGMKWIWKISKIFHWWMLLYHEEEGSDLDRFVWDTLMGCEISHICHKPGALHSTISSTCWVASTVTEAGARLGVGRIPANVRRGIATIHTAPAFSTCLGKQTSSCKGHPGEGNHRIRCPGEGSHAIQYPGKEREITDSNAQEKEMTGQSSSP